MKTIEGDLILEEDTVFEESIEVNGNIRGYYNLKVIGNINCLDINCGNINCGNIDCGNINCGNIDCLDIDCWDINCRNIDCMNIILCEKLRKKSKECVIRAKMLIENRDSLKVKEQKISEEIK